MQKIIEYIRNATFEGGHTYLLSSCFISYEVCRQTLMHSSGEADDISLVRSSRCARIRTCYNQHFQQLTPERRVLRAANLIFLICCDDTVLVFMRNCFDSELWRKEKELSQLH